MATANELVLAGHLADLRANAEQRSWDLTQFDGVRYSIGFQARDEQKYWLLLECDGYPTRPAGWRWHNPETGALDQPSCAPKGNSFLSTPICAPWNRYAYKQVHAKGPHNDWDLATWMSNAKTGRTTTLAGMALRLFVELQSKRYKGRAG